jgi:CheY-like chemotaxis protein
MDAKKPAPRVLVVDDEAAVRTLAERVLRDAGYEVVAVSDGPEALRVVEQQRPFNLYVIDLVMPQMTGDELARQLRRTDPDAKVLYFTGFIDQLFNSKSTLWENEAFLEKPATVNGLPEAVSLLLYGHTQRPQ